MPARTAEATWAGNLQQGNGSMKLGSGAYEGPFSFSSRFESGTGTNPEEMLGAALAGCFTMALANRLSKEGFTVSNIHTTANVHLEKDESGFSISRIELQNEGSVEGLDEAAYKNHAEETKKTCIVSRALGGVGQINVNAKLV